MVDRSRDWFAQAERDLDHARSARQEGRHEWACFAAQQATEKAVKALHLSLKQEAWGHVVARLLAQLPGTVPEELVDKAKVLDGFYIPSRYANGHPEGPLLSITERSRAGMRLLMPVRSSNTSVLKWPDRPSVEQAIRSLLEENVRNHPELLRLGYFGSYARGDWGVGSDLDLIAVVKDSLVAFEKRGLEWDLNSLPVPADLVVYTQEEWHSMQERDERFIRVLYQETVWIYPARK